MLNFKEFLALDEIESIKVKRRDKFGYGGLLGHKINSDVLEVSRLGKFSDHTVYRRNYSFYLTDKNGIVQMVLVTDPYTNRNNVLQVDVVSSQASNTIPAQKFYAWLIKKLNIVLVSGSMQSAGGKSVWERLSKEPGIGVHGWLDSRRGGTPVNLGAHLGADTEDETHIRPAEIANIEYNMDWDDDRNRKGSGKDIKDLYDIEELVLVAFKK